MCFYICRIAIEKISFISWRRVPQLCPKSFCLIVIIPRKFNMALRYPFHGEIVRVFWGGVEAQAGASDE
jgi:hypothetical protein